jgi:hypothetical protein
MSIEIDALPPGTENAFATNPMANVTSIYYNENFA